MRLAGPHPLLGTAFWIAFMSSTQYVSCRSFSATCKVSFVSPSCLMPPGYHVRNECRTQGAFVCKGLREDLAGVYPSEPLFQPLSLLLNPCLIICWQNLDEWRCQTSTSVHLLRHVPIRFLLHNGDCCLPNSNFGVWKDGPVRKVFAV